MSGYQGTATRHDAMEALGAMIEAERRDMRIVVAGEVVSYDKSTQTATIKPRLKQKFGDKTLEAPDLVSVPVQFQRGGGFVIHKPMKAGDEVTLLMHDRSLDTSADDASNADGHPGRMNDLSDAVAVPASYSKPKQMAGLPDGLHVGSEDGKSGLRVGDDKSVALHGGPDGGQKLKIDPASGKLDMTANGESLVAILRDTLVLFRDHLNGAAGMPAGNISSVNAIISRLNAMGL